MSLSIIIPCLNEVNTIDTVIANALTACRKYLKNDYEVIVADNGSTDGTLGKLSKLKNIKLMHIPVKGYGAALHYGIMSSKNSYVFFADADLSYDFDEIRKFLPFINDEYDLILGSRTKGHIEKGAMPFLNRYFGTPILTSLIKLLYGLKTTDCNSGMRVVKRSFYKKLKMQNSGMEWASELLTKTAINKGKYAEVPINFYRDKRGAKPHLRRWEDGWRHLKVIFLSKPTILLAFATFLAVLGLLVTKISLFTTIAFMLFAELLFFSFLAVKKLEAAIYKSPNPISLRIDRLPLVMMACVITILGLVQLVIISDNHLFTKYIFLFQVVLFDLWLFFIETIKTHIDNSLN